MKLTPEQQVVWFYTAFSAVTGASFPSEEADAAIATWLGALATKTGRDRSEMLSGMRQGINDMLAMARDARPDDIARADRALAQKGLPGVRKMAAVLGKKHLAILKRGAIKNDEELYIVAEILSDLEFEISESDRGKLGQISYAYETRAK